MENLTQSQKNAKQSFLDKQADEMLAAYKKADRSERNAVIRQIDSFLEVVPRDAKIFWLRFRHKLEKLEW